MKNKFINLYVSLNDYATKNNAEVISRLHLSGFKRHSTRDDLYYRTIYHLHLRTLDLGVSCYYYEKLGAGINKRKVLKNEIFDAMIKRIKDRAEQEEYSKSLNDSLGYTKEYFDSLNLSVVTI
jgi:hypothetical protein